MMASEDEDSLHCLKLKEYLEKTGELDSISNYLKDRGVRNHDRDQNLNLVGFKKCNAPDPSKYMVNWSMLILILESNITHN